MKASFRCLTVASFLTLLSVSSAAQQQSLSSDPVKSEQRPVNIKSSEVLLDVIVHDKKGRLVRDLKPEEIEVFEDGIKQTITQFRLIDPRSSSADKKAVQEAATSKEEANQVLNPSRPINLATMVFDNFDPGRVQTARTAALNFVDNSLAENTLVRIFVIKRKLYLIEHFTNERDKLRKAVDRALDPSEKSISANSGRIVENLKMTAGDAPSATEQPRDLEIVLARMTLDALIQANKMLLEMKSTSPIFSLLHIARAQRKQPGRKMVVYFSNGLYLPEGQNDVLRATISEANRANVSFYALDTRNLIASIGGVNSRLETMTVVNATRRPESARYSDANADSFSVSSPSARATGNFNLFEVMNRRMETNKQGALAELTENTGGFLIENTDDFNGALKRIAAEVGSYYVVSYSPIKQEYDGKFRTTTVKVARPDVKVKARNGYFADEPTENNTVLAYESPLLAALTEAILPNDFDLGAAALHFESKRDETHHVIVLETPLANFIGPEDPEKKTYPVGFSLLALIKDVKGEIVQKFSENHTLEIPSAQIEGARRSSAALTRDLWLATGSYTLEVIARDQKSNKLSARRKLFNVSTPQAGLQTGSLYLIKQIEQVDNNTAEDADNPLLAGKIRIVPSVEEEISLDGRDELSFHLAIFLQAKSAASPTLRLELMHEGKVAAATNPVLPEPDEKGRITFTAGIPAKGLVSGNYQLRAFVKQAESAAEESISFTLTGGAKRTDPADEGKVIESSLAASDTVGDLTLMALNAAKPVELLIGDLLKATESSGVVMHQRLGDYTYTLRKVRRVLDKKGRIREEEYKDYEAYPVKGQHALVLFSANGVRLTTDMIGIGRKLATEALINNEERKQSQEPSLNLRSAYWAAGLEGFAQNKFVTITINPVDFFRSCEFSSPRTVLLGGRETIVMNFHPRENLTLDLDKSWILQLQGLVWIDAADKALVRLEGFSLSPAAVKDPRPAAATPNFIYQQHQLSAGIWSPQLIRINAAGDDNLFRGLNWDAWFEFSNFKRFDSSGSDLKLVSPENKKPNRER